MLSQMKRFGKRLLVSVLAFTMLGSAAMVFTSAPGLETVVFAEGEIQESGDFSYRLLDDGTAKVVKYNGTDTDVTIPSYVWNGNDAVTVSEVAASTISNNSTVETITVPDSVKTVRKEAFATLSSLRYVVFEGSDTVIEGYAFGYDARYEFNGNTHQMEYRYYKEAGVSVYGPKKPCTASNYASAHGFAFYTITNNTSSLEKDTFLTTEKVNVLVNGNGGYGDNTTYHYKIELYKRALSGKFYRYVLQSDNKPVYDGTLHAYFKINTPGKYRISVTLYDTNEFESTSYLYCTVYAPVKNEATISCSGEDYIVPGMKATVTANASGGDGTYSYSFLCKKGEITGSDINNAEATDETEKIFSFTEVGDYQVLSLVRDSDNRVDYKIFDVAVKSEFINTTTVSDDHVLLGDSVTIYGDSIGSYGSVRYFPLYRLEDGDWKIIHDPTTVSTFTFTPSQTGQYTIRVQATDSAKASSVRDFSLIVYQELQNNSYLYDETITKGSSVTAYGVAAYGVAPYKYAAWYKKTGATSWTTAQNYSSKNKITFTPKYASKYSVCVKVKDAMGTVKKKYLTVNVVAPLENTSTLSASAIEKGKSVTVNASAKGGTKPYKFGVWYKKSTASTWTKKSGYTSKTTTFTIKPNYTGTYQISVKVKDANGTVKKKSLTVEVTAALQNTSTVSATSIKKGESVKITASAKGGTKPYKFGVWYKKSTASSWTKKADYSTKTSYTFTPKSQATYYLHVNVKDANGTVKKKSFTITVS